MVVEKEVVFCFGVFRLHYLFRFLCIHRIALCAFVIKVGTFSYFFGGTRKKLVDGRRNGRTIFFVCRVNSWYNDRTRPEVRSCSNDDDDVDEEDVMT